MEHGRNKFLKLNGGGAVASSDKPEPLNVSDQHHLEGLDQMGDGGSDGRNPSLYLALCRRRDWSACETSSPLYKVAVDLPDPNSGDDDSSSPGPPPPVRLHRRCDLDTDMAGKAFAYLPKPGWILGVGGNNPGGAIIFDTRSSKVIRAPEFVSRKWNPVVAVAGDRVYALTRTPSYVQDLDFPPWFEVLDLSNPVVTETEEGVLYLQDSCSWKALPHPVFFPHLLTPRDFRNPPYITVRSSVVIGHYILVSLNQPSNCIFAFDTNSGEWHKIAGEYLPLVGAATPHGHGGDIFLACSQENGPIKAYRIHVVSNMSGGPSEKKDEYAVKLSITEMTVRNKEHFEVVRSDCYISLDREHFSVLFCREGSGRFLVYDKKTEETYPRKLYLRLATYRTESPVVEGKTPEIVISSQREQTFKVCSSFGFSSFAPIAFALYI